ncbi:MAG: L-rhamnose mutarotase [Verrucomicrobiota bacterium]
MNIPYGSTNRSPEEKRKEKPRRFTSMIELNPEKELYYRELHANVWPSVLKRLAESQLRQFSISMAPISGKKYLVSHFEYWGDDFESDMAKIAKDPETQRWWRETDPCQIPLTERESGGHWMNLEEVFFFNPKNI